MEFISSYYPVNSEEYLICRSSSCECCHFCSAPDGQTFFTCAGFFTKLQEEFKTQLCYDNDLSFKDDGSCRENTEENNFFAVLSMQRQYIRYLIQLVMFLFKKFTINGDIFQKQTEACFSKYTCVLRRQFRLIEKLFNEKRALMEFYDIFPNILQKLKNATKCTKIPKYDRREIQMVKEFTVKSLEPQIEMLISKHKREINEVRSAHMIELSNTMFQLRHAYEDKIRLIDEKNTIDLKRAKFILSDEIVFQADRKLINERQLYHSRMHMQVGKLEILKSTLSELHFDIIMEKELYAENTNHILKDIQAMHKMIMESIGSFQKALKNRSSTFWKKEISRFEVNLEQMHKRTLIKREQQLFRNYKRNKDEEIERIIENLEWKFNEEKMFEHVKQSECISLIKLHYEKQISELVQSNIIQEEKFSALEKPSQHVETDSLNLLGNQATSIDGNLEVYKLSNPTQMVASKLNEASQECHSAILIENSHLKHYIKKLELGLR